nr:hypothetical protein CFP56_37153 [Quercus suber]
MEYERVSWQNNVGGGSRGRLGAPSVGRQCTVECQPSLLLSKVTWAPYRGTTVSILSTRESKPSSVAVFGRLNSSRSDCVYDFATIELESLISSWRCVGSVGANCFSHAIDQLLPPLKTLRIEENVSPHVCFYLKVLGDSLMIPLTSGNRNNTASKSRNKGTYSVGNMCPRPPGGHHVLVARHFRNRTRGTRNMNLYDQIPRSEVPQRRRILRVLLLSDALWHPQHKTKSSSSRSCNRQFPPDYRVSKPPKDLRRLHATRPCLPCHLLANHQPPSLSGQPFARHGGGCTCRIPSRHQRNTPCPPAFAMADVQIQQLIDQLAIGFETLQDEYTKLFAQHGAVERKLATAREQYNELAKLYGSGPLATPPLSLSSLQHKEIETPYTAAAILEQRSDENAREASSKLRAASAAIESLRRQHPSRSSQRGAAGVRIWSGPAADKPEVANSSVMPSISESPLEQDFTIEGKPSRLGCPFASMSSKKLSSHAASVLSRYNAPGSGAPSTTPLSSVSKLNGRDGRQSKHGSRRTSLVDPIKAEICGLSDHHDVDGQDLEQAIATHEQEVPVEEAEDADVGVCPIRFLDQHSPEEVATYFEKHKHELPRSHEVCVRRYQSNENQIRELDAKYGNIVSMIQGLGAKHKDYLPDEPDPEQEGETAVEDARSNEKVRKWATNVSVQAADGQDLPDDAPQEEERQPHFERPLRDIRVGESPSRPWGISIPHKYLEHGTTSETSSRPAQVTVQPVTKSAEPASRPEGKCPFGFDKAPPQTLSKADPKVEPAEKISDIPEQAAFLGTPQLDTKPVAGDAKSADAKPQQPSMLFTGPVFIGYSAEDAAKILRDSGLGQPHS